MRRSRLHIPTLLAVVCSVVPTGMAAQDEAVAIYHRGIADHFELPPDEVRVLAESRLRAEEVPVVLFLARQAGVSADALVALKRSGSSWDDLARRYDLGPGIFHVPVQGSVTTSPLSRAYRAFRETPSAEWDAIRLEDAEVVGLVNLRVLSEYLGVAPSRVLEARAREGSFIEAFRVLRRGLP